MIIWHKTGAVLVLAIVVLIPRVLDLDAFLTADEKRWRANVAGFVTELAHGDLTSLVQQPHPGITTQWLAGSTVFSDSWGIRKLPLVIAQSVLVLLIGYVAWHLWGTTSGILVTLALALSPPLVAHTRVLAMDSLLALFFVLALLCLLTWRHRQAAHYLAYSGIAAAAAWLSKLPGILLVPLALVYISNGLWRRPKEYKQAGRAILLWSAVFVIASIIILPSLGLSFLPTIGDFLEMFRSDDYTDMHKADLWYYAETIFFFSTPFFVGTLILTVGGWKIAPRSVKNDALLLLFAAIVFAGLMTIGEKKGDRYILPTLLLLDVAAAALLAPLLERWANSVRSHWLTAAVIVAGVSFIWQASLLWQLHPHALAYVNPLTRPWYGERRLGWGEGLDLAAEYLNEKPNAADLKVSTFYPNEFGYRFHGESVPMHKFDSGSVDYAIAYRAMFERGAEAWETDVLRQLSDHTPEHVITLGGLEYVWIYRLEK